MYRQISRLHFEGRVSDRHPEETFEHRLALVVRVLVLLEYGSLAIGVDGNLVSFPLEKSPSRRFSGQRSHRRPARIPAAARLDSRSTAGPAEASAVSPSPATRSASRRSSCSTKGRPGPGAVSRARRRPGPRCAARGSRRRVADRGPRRELEQLEVELRERAAPPSALDADRLPQTAAPRQRDRCHRRPRRAPRAFPRRVCRSRRAASRRRACRRAGSTRTAPHHRIELSSSGLERA